MVSFILAVASHQESRGKAIIKISWLEVQEKSRQESQAAIFLITFLKINPNV